MASHPSSHGFFFLSRNSCNLSFGFSVKLVDGDPFHAVYPERLPEDKELQAIDVFICTADPKKEPTLGVMNTVISAMTLDYPSSKLFVYLSDDAGAPITLYGMKEAYKFAKKWIPFCKKYGIKTIAPDAYFSGPDHEEESGLLSSEFIKHGHQVEVYFSSCSFFFNFRGEHRCRQSFIQKCLKQADKSYQTHMLTSSILDKLLYLMMQEEYQVYKKRLERAIANGIISSPADRPCLIEVSHAKMNKFNFSTEDQNAEFSIGKLYLL